jgi:outer membrane protein|nr:OmpH family outer membrane protein [Kofleriaceae bacterium]
MNRFAAIALIGLGLVVAPLVVPALGAVPAQPKIGVVDLEKMLTDTPAGKRNMDQLQASQKAKQAELDKKKQAVMAANQELQKQQAVLKPEALQKKRDELQQAYIELGQLASKLEHELSDANAQATKAVLVQAEPLIKDLAKAEGCTLIVDARELVWVDPSLDLTDKLDAKMK